MACMLFSFSDAQIKELRELATKEFCQPVSLEEAQVMGDTLLQLYELLCSIGHKP